VGKIQTEIFEATVEEKLMDPTFITRYPTEVSPLSRRNDDDPSVTDRFELFVGGREIANGFSELNDAEDQADRFKEQVADKNAGDEEAMHYDADYIRALEYGMQVAILFEGRDAAGKGGTIKRFTEHLNPRGARVVALEKPTEVERNQWFFQRYVHHLPSAGDMRFFDRSWYNRAGVERVMGFCTPAEYLEFMRQAPQLEQMFVRSGILLFKYWFSVSQKQQAMRFESRKRDPLKQWKLSPIDEASMSMWDKYTEAKEAMFFYTDTADAPWTIIKSDDKKRARLACMQHFLSNIDYPDKDEKVVVGPDPKIVISGQQMVSKINSRKRYEP